MRSLSLQYTGLKGSLHGGFSAIDNKFGRAILKIDEPEVNEKFGGVKGISRPDDLFFLTLVVSDVASP